MPVKFPKRKKRGVAGDATRISRFKGIYCIFHGFYNLFPFPNVDDSIQQGVRFCVDFLEFNKKRIEK
jgi:hypothetical protein